MKKEKNDNKNTKETIIQQNNDKEKIKKIDLQETKSKQNKSNTTDTSPNTKRKLSKIHQIPDRYQENLSFPEF